MSANIALFDKANSIKCSADTPESLKVLIEGVLGKLSSKCERLNTKMIKSVVVFARPVPRYLSVYLF